MPSIQQQKKRDIIRDENIRSGLGRAMVEFVAKHSLINCPGRSARALNQMGHGSVWLFLGMKGPWATNIHRRLLDVLASNAISYSRVTKHLGSANVEVKRDGSDERPGDSGTNLTDGQILHTREISLLRQCAKLLR
jgi:hypothetical protein